MFWKSVVGKLAVTIVLLVSFVLFILTILLLEFFEGFHVQEAEKAMMQTADKVSVLVEQHDDLSIIIETAERVKDPASRVMIVFGDGTTWMSQTNNKELLALSESWLNKNDDFSKVVKENETMNKQVKLPNQEGEIIIVGTPIENKNGAVFVYQSLEVINQTRAETTKIIFVAAGIAIFLTTIFAFFLSTRITSPLIKMREAAFELTRGEFNTKVPILTRDEIGELAIAFNHMGKQLQFHINALRQEKEQLSSILRSMADGVITLNRAGNMIVTNPPAENFIEDLYFEYNLDDPNETKQLPEPLSLILEKVVKEEKEVLQEINLQGRNWVMIMTPLYDQSYVRGAVAVIRDMTEERRLDKLRKDFIANVSHELRTPISLMQGYSEAIVDDIAESKDEKNELAKIILEESLRMGRLVNDLLDIGRVEAGHNQLRMELVDVEQFMDRIYKKFDSAIQANDVGLTLNKTIKEAMAYIDPDAMEQVFTNLIDNALSHVEVNGRVNINIESNEHYFIGEIEDNGSGIPEDDLPFIFERFYKADKSRTRSGQKRGTGLGLAIVKNIIEAHNGSISVKSKLGQGTMFTFKVPQKGIN